MRNLASLGRGGRVLALGAVLHAFFEAFDGTAQVLADVFQLLVPKTSTTISKTTSQCQIEKEPMKDTS